MATQQVTEFFVGWRQLCWCLTHRVGQDLPYPQSLGDTAWLLCHRSGCHVKRPLFMCVSFPLECSHCHHCLSSNLRLLGMGQAILATLGPRSSIQFPLSPCLFLRRFCFHSSCCYLMGFELFKVHPSQWNAGMWQCDARLLPLFIFVELFWRVVRLVGLLDRQGWLNGTIVLWAWGAMLGWPKWQKFPWLASPEWAASSTSSSLVLSTRVSMWTFAGNAWCGRVLYGTHKPMYLQLPLFF